MFVDFLYILDDDVGLFEFDDESMFFFDDVVHYNWRPIILKN